MKYQSRAKMKPNFDLDNSASSLSTSNKYT